jgi:hypothetical protein
MAALKAAATERDAVSDLDGRNSVVRLSLGLTGLWSGPATPDWWHDDLIAATASPGNFRAVAKRQILTQANADLTQTVVAINCDR